MHNSVGDLMVLHFLGVSGVPSKALRVVPVNWGLLAAGQIKINTNGEVDEAPSLVG